VRNDCFVEWYHVCYIFLLLDAFSDLILGILKLSVTKITENEYFNCWSVATERWPILSIPQNKHLLLQIQYREGGGLLFILNWTVVQTTLFSDRRYFEIYQNVTSVAKSNCGIMPCATSRFGPAFEKPNDVDLFQQQLGRDQCNIHGNVRNTRQGHWCVSLKLLHICSCFVSFMCLALTDELYYTIGGWGFKFSRCNNALPVPVSWACCLNDEGARLKAGTNDECLAGNKWLGMVVVK
jgi:hypothetical protein